MTGIEIAGILTSLGVGGLLMKAYDRWTKRKDKAEEKEEDRFDALERKMLELELEYKQLKERYDKVSKRNGEIVIAVKMAVEFMEQMYPDSSDITNIIKGVIRDTSNDGR